MDNLVVLSGTISIKPEGLTEYPVYGGKVWLGASIAQRTEVTKADGTKVMAFICGAKLKLTSESVAKFVGANDGQAITVKGHLKTEDVSGKANKGDWVTFIMVDEVITD